MADRGLGADLAEEHSAAIRLLLATPLIDAAADPDGFRLVTRHGGWLAVWFDAACGWDLVVDPGAGFARLGKRGGGPDPVRPLRRTRGASQPFDRRRYQLLCLACAELVRHPVTTVGLLAGALVGEAGLDTARHGERAAFVDALRALAERGVLRVSAGDVDAFLGSAEGNAILAADTARLHRLLVGAVAPSLLDDGLDTAAATAALRAEPRYGPAPTDPAEADEEQRLRWVRHSLARRLLDDPVVYLEDLSAAERDYLANPAGRRWVRDRVAEAGLELEERAEGLLAVDPGATATDRVFPAPAGNAHQLALLLLDRLAGGADAAGPGSLDPAALRREVDAVLARFPGWARGHRDGDGPDRLAQEAVELLVGFGLARTETDGTVAARPALARYRVGEPVLAAAQPSLFEEGA